MNEDCTCPVCGYPDLPEPAVSQGVDSLEICASCGFQFGVTDLDRGLTYEDWRAKWIAEGMRFRIPEDEPPGWDPREQLRSAGLSG